MSHTTPKSSARDVFSYLLLIVMFIVGVVSFLTLLFLYVNIQFPDVLTGDYWYRDSALAGIRGSISALIVSWPVVIVMSIFIGKDLRENVGKQQIWIRKWLLHLMLFLSALTIIIDLITLINYYLDGEMSLRFGIKVLAVLLVVVAVFWYERWELHRDPKKESKISLWSAVGSSVVILVFIVASMFVAGFPSSQRDARMDQERVFDLQSIQSALVDFYQDKEVLPETLDELEDDIIAYHNPTDPQTQDNYTYAKTGELSFSLCATFQTKSDGRPFSNPVNPRFGNDGNDFDIWEHEAGEVCFERTIDPDRIKEVNATLNATR